jgi:hypothetical protein
MHKFYAVLTFTPFLFHDAQLISYKVESNLFIVLPYLFTYLLTPWSRVLLEKLPGSQLAKKFLAMYGTP